MAALVRRARRSTAALAALAASITACSRTPPEPTPTTTDAQRTTTTMSAEPRSAGPSHRCIAPLPDVAPTIPPAADASRCPPDPEPSVRMPLAEVSFPDAPAAPRVEVELAMTPHDIERGLMYRRSMADTHGMLFKLDGRRDHTFWMHNTCIPLDMLFVDDDGTIVGIVEGAAPLTDTTRSVGCPSSFVLELNGGWARKHGLRPGQKLALPSAVR